MKRQPGKKIEFDAYQIKRLRRLKSMGYPESKIGRFMGVDTIVIRRIWDELNLERSKTKHNVPVAEIGACARLDAFLNWRLV